MTDEFYDFEKALSELKMEEEELKRLVSAGEIRAFRSKGQMKFRKQDIDDLRTGGLDDAEEEETLTNELVFDETDPLSIEDEEEGMATAKIDEQDTLIDEELPDIESDISDLEEESFERSAPAKPVTRRATRVTRLREAQEARKEASPLFFALMVLTTILLLYGVVFLANIANNQQNGMTEGVSGFMVESFTEPID